MGSKIRNCNSDNKKPASLYECQAYDDPRKY